jgi:hypothetical protein
MSQTCRGYVGAVVPTATIALLSDNHVFGMQWTTDQQVEDLVTPFGKTETIHLYENHKNGFKFSGYVSISDHTHTHTREREREREREIDDVGSDSDPIVAPA